MIKVSVLYPNGDDVTFDVDYYIATHIKMVKDLLGDALKEVRVETGLMDVTGEKPPYIAMAHLTFESTEAFQAAFGPHAETLADDVPKFTNSVPLGQVNEIKI